MPGALSQPAVEEDKKLGNQAGIHINLKGKGQDGNEVFFRIKRSTQLKKSMNAYCDRQSVEFNSIAFLFDGRRLRGEQTPDEKLQNSKGKRSETGNFGDCCCILTQSTNFPVWGVLARFGDDPFYEPIWFMFYYDPKRET